MTTGLIPFRAQVPGRGGDRLSALALHWNADDGSLDCLSGQVGTFSRPSAGGSAIDGTGQPYSVPYGIPRWTNVLDNQTGKYRSGLLLDNARANLVTQSENLAAAPWSDIGTPTVTVGALTVGELSLDLLSDLSGSVAAGRRQTVTFATNGIKFGIVYIAQHTDSNASVIRVRDTTTAADVFLAQLSWSGGAPVVTPVTPGTPILGQRQLGTTGVWELRYRTTAVTASHNNVLEVYPAALSNLDPTYTGRLYVGGVAFFDGNAGTSYLKTTTVSVTLSAEQMSFPFLLPRYQRRTWLYVAFTELGGRYNIYNGRAGIGENTGAASLGLLVADNGYGVQHGGPGEVVVTGSTYPVYGQLVELLATMSTTGAMTLNAAFDGVLQTPAGPTASPASMTAGWTNATAFLGSYGIGSNQAGGAAYHSMKVGDGVPSLASARGYR